MRTMHWTSNRTCEDCGRSKRAEALYSVEWTWRSDTRELTTWLQLCDPCARRMAKAFKDDPTTTLFFRPI